MTIECKPPFRETVLSEYGNVPIYASEHFGPQRPGDNVLRFPVARIVRIVPKSENSGGETAA